MHAPASTVLLLFVTGLALFLADRHVRDEAAVHKGLERLSFSKITDFEASFEEPLSFDPAHPPIEALPAHVRALHGQSFSLQGYMQVLEHDEEDSDLVRQFLLTEQAPGCCSGHVPRLQDYVLVTMDGAPTELVALRTCNVEGRFTVEPWVDEEGDVLVLFRMQATRVRKGR